MPVRDKVYEKMKSFGLTDSKEDFYKYYDSDENVRKDVFRRLQEDGLTDTEEEFYSYMQPTVVKSEESALFDANVERAKRGEPIQRVSTQSMINAHPELGLSDSSYEYKPEVQQHILDNKPDIFKPKQSLMDAPLNTSAPEGSQEKFNERIGVAVKNLNDPTVQKSRTEAEFRGLNASVYEELKSIEDQITSRAKAIRNENWRPGMPSTRDDSGLASLRGQRSYLEGAKELLEESEKIINASKDEKDGTFIGGILRGTRDKVFDVDTWTMGLSDLVGGLRLKNVLEKVEKDEQLSSAEEKLLDAAVTNMAVNAYFASDLGKGYKAGQVTGESIPFMLEMAINPISASGNKLAKSLLKAGMKRFGSSINNNVAKATTRLATDALAATGMAATTGMPGVLGETVDRLNKNYNYGIDANGNLYAQKTGDVSFGEALGRSFTTRALENQSEMIFRAFDGAGELLKGVNVSLPGGVNTFFDYIKNSKVGELWRGIKNSPLRKELAEATKVGGIGEEYLEEVYNNFANVALGEMSMEEALNLDNNIDTFLGLAPTQVMFSMLGLGNMAALRYKTRRDIEDLRATMNESQRQALDGLLAMGTTATNQDVHEFIRNTMANQSLSIDEKRNAVKAAYDVARQKAMADVQEAEVEDKIAEENADIDAKTDPQTGNYGEVTLLGMDESGEPTANTANVFGAKIVDGELYLLVLPEGETEKKWARPHEYDAESHQIMPGAEVKAYNEQMIRDNAAKQAEQEAKYAPDVLNAQMQQGIPFEDATAVYIPFQVTPEGNAWQVEVYNKDENGNQSKKPTRTDVITNDQFRDMLQAQYEANEAAQQQPVQEIAPTTEAEVTNTPVATEEVTPTEEVQPEVVEEVQQPQQQAPVIPTKEDGSIDFVSYGKDNTFKTLGEKYGEKMPNKVAVTAKALAEDLVKAQEKLSKAEEAYDNAPIGREQKAEQARDKAKAELESIQREADFWSSLDNEIKEAQAKRDALLNPKADVDMSEEPMNADEFIAQQLANGNIALESASYKKETGYGEKERQKFIKMFRKAENGGMSIESAGDLLMQMDRENGTNFFNQNDANSGRDALINFLGSVSSWGDVTGYIRNNREAQAAKETEGLRNEIEDAIEANYHMTPEEYATLQEMEATENPFEGVDIEAKDAIFAEAALEFEEYLKSLENGQGTTEEVIEGNSDVLSEEQSDNTGGTEQRQGEGFDVSEGTVQSDDAAQEESAEVEEGNTPFRQTESILEQAERIANEEARRKPLRQRAKEWEQKLGVKVNIIEDFDDVTNKDAKRAIRNGQRVTGWYEESTGEVCLYMPYLESAQEIDATYIHEVVAHKGLRGLLGDKFDEFLDDVWSAMSEADKLIYLTYPGVNGNKRAAADEYIAHLAENIDVTESAWGKLAELIKKFLKAIGLEPKMTHADIANTIKLSYQRLLSGEGGVDVAGDGTRFRILEEINQTFNEELQQQIDGTLPNGHIYQLGSPSAVLLSTGIADVPIELNSTRLEDKSKNFGNDYDLSELKDLVKAIHNPMAIFAYGDKSKAQNIIVEIQHEGKNFIVGLSIKPKVGGQILDINSIRNVFSKDNAEWLNWVSQGKLLYADKERIQDLINQQQTNLADVDYLDLDSIANIVKDFPNPTLPEEKTLFRTVYHGSGASFDKFDHSFMGTGEGNQSFGWGTYVTDVEGIGKQYASIYAKNSPLAANALRWIEENGTYEDFLAQGEGKRRNWAIRHAKDYLKELKKDGASEDVIKAYEQDLVDAENALSEEAYNRTKENMVASLNRNLYEVEIPDNDGTNYIAWDKMLPKEQAERIKEAVRNSDFFKDYEKEYGRLAEERLDSWTKTNGGRAYKLLGNFTHMDQGADKAISQLLSKAGFVGFEYPANYMSGGNDFGQKNYVIFDEKDLQIKEHTRFRVLNDKSGKKTLVGLHNISENKLRKAIKQGGLANPSVAVIDMDKQSHTDYGDITFVIPSSMIDKKTGKNVGTYLADAYTPVYPTVVKKMSDKGAKALTKALESVNEIFRSKVRTYFNSYLDSGTIYDALAYWYLSDTGKNPPILEAALPEGFTKEEVEKVKSINSEADSFFQLSEDEKQKALNLYADKFFGGMKEYENHLSDYTKRMQEVVKDESKPQMVRKNIQQNLNTIERYGYEYDRVAGYYNRAVFLADRQSKPSEIETFRNAFDEVSKNGLEEDFGNWLMAKEEEFGVEEKLFAGYDNQGRAKYLPNTLENASKLMKKEGRAGATGLGGFNYFVAILAPVAKTTKQISAKKGNLSTQEEYDKFVEEWKDYYHDLARQLQPGAGKWDDYGYHRLHEIAPMANPKAYVKKEYGIDLSDEFLKDLNDVKNAIKNDFPARYFETKFERPVYLNEVAAAVVPSDMSLDLYGQLQRMGIPMYEYERGNNEARMEAIDKVTIDNDGIRFRFIGEQGARNLDKAEEATTRLDNLSVAREMEAAEKDAKTIKMATGWERGADGLWRYETMDSETAIKDGDEVEIRKQIEDIEEEEKSYKKKAKAEGIDEDERYEAYIGFNRRRGFLEAQLAYVMVKNADVLTHIDVSLYHVLDKENSENLFKAYPELEFVRVGFATEIHGKSLGATIINGSKIEAIHLDVKRSTPEELNGYLAHEIQHAIQEIEGFAPGGNPSMESPRKAEQKIKNISFIKDKLNKSVSERNSLLKQRNEINDKMSAWWDAHEDAIREDMLADKDMQQYNQEYDELSKQIDEADKNVKFNERWLDATLQANTALGYEGYKKLAGEVEARNVSRRMMLSADDRRNMLAVETEDVAREDQIFLMDGMESGISDMRFRIAPQEEVQSEVDKFTSKYNGKEVVVLNSTVSDEELESLGLDVEDVREAIEKETEGFYDPITDKIYIFADIADADELEKTLFHENGHGIFRKNKKFVNEFNENSKDKFKKGREDIAKYYKEHERAEELFVRIFDQELTSGNFEYLPKYLSEELWDEFNDILKDFGYDRQEESDRRRKGSVVRTETDRGFEKEADVRNSDIEPNQREERKEKGRSKEQAERLKKLFDDVADMGLRGVLGNTNYDLAMLDVFYALPEKERTDVAVRAVKIGGDVAVAVDEYLNSLEEPTLWEKVIASITNALRKVGIDVQLTENDVKYLLWRSRKPLDRNSIFDMAEDIDMRRKLNVGKFDNDPTDGGDTPGGGTRFRTSSEINNQYPNWLDGTTTESGKHSTQVEGTRKTYNKIGTWIEENLGKDISILDASSGMGYGTSDLRERGFNIEDVEPYQSDERKANNPATYSSYNDINKQYDFIISNAVLNVIPDDWRQNVLHDMASRLKDGGRMFINTRKAGEEKTIKDKIELDSPQEVLVKRNGKIASYQKFFTPSELKEWVETELGNSYKVEIANRNNSGTNGLAAVVVTKVAETLNGGTRFRVTPKMDAEYLEAVNSGDMEKAQKMVNEAAKMSMPNTKVVDENGDPLVVYHGSGKKFYTFKSSNKRFYGSPDAYFFTDDKVIGEDYSNGYLIPAFLNIENPKIVDFKGSSWSGEIFENGKHVGSLGSSDSNVKKAHEEGYDGAILKNIKDAISGELADRISTDYVAFESNQIKSAEPVTYDDNGNVIPLSERFNSESNDIRFRVANKLQIRDEYESTIKKGGYQAREAVQDAMLSLRRTQELIEKASGKKLRGFENAWEHENRMSSVVQAEIHEMERKFYKPMMDAVKKLAEAMGDKNDYAVADYLMLKHGIERNREMAVRKALTDTEGKIDRTQLEQWYKDKDAIRNDANLPTWREKQEAMDNAALNYGADMSVDYSGLTSMFGTDDLADCTDKAYKEVESLEKKYPSETKALGKAVKALNQNTIDKSFESGLMDRKVRDELKNDMYDYYVPLRGFDEVTSDEVYSYLDNDRNAFNAPLRRAKGRTSKADNPIAYMKSIAESGIMQGERNKMKQSFLNMVTNHPSDLISVREGVWVVLNLATGEWEAASMPTIPNNATPADVESILEAWEASMEQQAATNPNIKKISEGADIPYRVIGNRMEQHQVIIKRNGKSYTLTVNGNPRLAMALNGLTNPNNTSKDGRVAADIQKAVDKMNRTLAAWYTTRNPDFVASNFMRDTFYTNTIVRAKEGNKYANKFHKHYAELLIPGKMLSLFNKYENGKLDMNNKTEKAFYDFIMNGGETGYSNLKDIEHIKNEIANQLKGDRLKWFRQVSDKLDLVNRAVENTSRFAAFLTSREMGRDMSKSIFDAKEISVNFNKKGAGGTFYKGTGQTKFGNLAAMVGAGGRGLYVFFNAAIQGSTNLLHVMKVNPKGTSTGLAAMFLMGAVLPYLLSGDDDKDYYDLPDHVRRNHLVLPGAGDTWVSIPLPIEYRIMYGMGELFTSWRTGHERGSNVALKALSLTGQALPLNFLEEGLDAFVPSALSPLWQAYNNRSWTGLPIYKDNEFNKYDPEYTKAYKNVDRLIYNFTKSLYDWTFDEENQEAGIDLNPAVIESLARGYFGGLFTQMSNIVKTAETIGGEREFDWRNIPIGNRIFKSGDEQTKEKRLTNEYFNNMEKLDFLESRRRMLNRTIDGKAVPEEDVEKAKADLEQMIQTGVYQKYMKFKEYKKVADKIRKAMKDNGSTEELQRKLSEAQEKANEVLR